MTYLYSVKNPTPEDVADALPGSLGPTTDPTALAWLSAVHGPGTLPPYYLLKYDQPREFPTEDGEYWGVELEGNLAQLQAFRNPMYDGVYQSNIATIDAGKWQNIGLRWNIERNIQSIQYIVKTRLSEEHDKRYFDLTFNPEPYFNWLRGVFGENMSDGHVSIIFGKAQVEKASEEALPAPDSLRIEILDDIIARCKEYFKMFPDRFLSV